MQNFKYVARDRAGKASAGTIQAADEVELRRILRSNDLYLTRARGSGGAVTEGKPRAGAFEAKPTLQDMVIATRQLGTTVRAGLPIIEALGIVGSQSNKPALRQAFADVEQGVKEGQFLSAGMRKHPKLFNRLVVSLVEAGEVAGTLDHTLEVAAEQLDREDNLRRKVKAATMYPKMVVFACMGTIAGMLLFVVPVFANVYGGLHAKLPAPTLLLIAISNLVVHLWWLAAVLIGVLTVAFKRWAATEKGQRKVDTLVLKIPVLGDLLRKIAIARFVQTLAGSMRGGVPVLASLAISANTAGNAVVREAVEAAADAVRDGAAIAPELERTGQFPVLVTRIDRKSVV